MLHSTLPRAFLPPGLSYLGGYYGEDAHLYTAAASAGYVPCIEDPYARIPDQRVHLGSWESSARPMSPCPLDLSLKPPQSLDPPGDLAALEVDDDDDRRCRADLQRRILPSKRSYSNSEEMASVLEESEGEIRRSPSVHSYHSYDEVSSHKEPMDHRSSVQNPLLQDENIRGLVVHRYHSYEDVPTKKEVLDPREFIHKGHPTQDPSSVSISTEPEAYHSLSAQKELLLASPNHSRTLNYHQQLLLTPQHHLQVNAPMTPPSTPSPPQCPRRRPREDPEVTPPHSATSSSIATPKSALNLAEKSAARPKKKHARRLKFDEDTSSPVSGTVILGPDEAVVTGDIDPAFNIVEVTEEARAELAKIENRLGPYQCKLCRQLHDDAFQLAQHRCSRIAHVEYRCPECDKRFSCPANLASHRRWHKPRIANGEASGGIGNPGTSANGTNTPNNKDSEIGCTRCDAKFTRPAALRKHLATQHPESNNNVSINNNNSNNNNNNNNMNGDDNNSSGFHDTNSSMLGKTLCVPGNVHLVNASLTNEIP